jgi:hypothetical protein
LSAETVQWVFFFAGQGPRYQANVSHCGLSLSKVSVGAFISVLPTEFRGNVPEDKKVVVNSCEDVDSVVGRKPGKRGASKDDRTFMVELVGMKLREYG